MEKGEKWSLEEQIKNFMLTSSSAQQQESPTKTKVTLQGDNSQSDKAKHPMIIVEEEIGWENVGWENDKKNIRRRLS